LYFKDKRFIYYSKGTGRLLDSFTIDGRYLKIPFTRGRETVRFIHPLGQEIPLNPFTRDRNFSASFSMDRRYHEIFSQGTGTRNTFKETKTSLYEYIYQ
jgi:hypothetical protein